MDTTPNITDWLEAVGTVITALVSLFLLRQITLTKEQLESTVKWNKVNATFTYFTNAMFMERERIVSEVLSKLGIDLYLTEESLDDHIVKEILNDPLKYREVKDFLNLLEDYAAAVRVGAFDPDCSYNIMSEIIPRYKKVFMPFIKELRDIKKNELVFIELENVALVWESRYEKEKQEELKKLEEAREKTQAELEKKKQLLEAELQITEKQINERRGVKKVV